MRFQRHRAVVAAAMALAVAVWPGAGFAAGEQAPAPSAGATIPGGLNQDEALARLGMYFHLPAEQPEAHLDSRAGKQVWSFSWSRRTSPNSTAGFANASVEKETGTILEFYASDPAALPVAPEAAKVTEAQARQHAEDLFKRLVPAEHQTAMAPWKYEEGYYDAPFGQPKNFTLTWVRQIAGIPYPVDRVSIGIDVGTGDVTTFMTSWTDQVEHGAADKHLSPEAARKEFRTALGMEPFYQPVRARKSWRPRGADNWVPAYRIRAQVTEMDAISGQFLGNAGKVTDLSAYVHKPLDGFTGALPGELPLSASTVETWLHSVLGLPEQPVGNSYPDLFNGKNAMRFSFMDPEAGQNGSGAVDLERGLVLDLERNDGSGPVMFPGGGNAPAAGEDQQALDAATALARSLYPTLKGSLGTGMVTAGWGPPGQTDVFFPRLHAGLPVGQEGLHVLVDGEGKWQSVHLQWSKRGPDDAAAFSLSPEQAADRFFTTYEPVLVWLPDMSEGFDPMSQMPPAKVRLAYTLLPNGSDDGGFEQVLDGRTGHFLDFQGRDISLVRQVRAVLLAGPEGPELAAMLDRGALSVKDGLIDPNRLLTRGEAVAFIFSDPYGGGCCADDRAMPYTDIPDEHPLYDTVLLAVYRSVLTPVGQAPVLGPDHPVTRAEFAVMAARYMGLGELAKSDIQVVSPYKDTGSVSPEQQRAIAFLAGLKILDREENFRPDHAITLAEAAVIATRLHPYGR